MQATGNPAVDERVTSGDTVTLHDGTIARLVAGGDPQLTAMTLQRGQCTKGELVFEGAGMLDAEVGYRNAGRDEVSCYRYGKVPKR